MKGKNVIKEGISDLGKKGDEWILFKGKGSKIGRFMFGGEGRMDKDRRRDFVVRMNKIYKKDGRRGLKRG